MLGDEMGPEAARLKRALRRVAANLSFLDVISHVSRVTTTFGTLSIAGGGMRAGGCVRALASSATAFRDVTLQPSAYFDAEPHFDAGASPCGSQTLQ